MIVESELKNIGRLLKPHGITGEVVALIKDDVDLSEVSCVVLDIDGIFVPFFLTSVRQKSSETDLLTIDGISNENEAAGLCGRDLYVRMDEIPSDSDGQEGLYAEDLVGYDAYADEEYLGKITGINDSTANYLFIIERPGAGQCLVPVADEFIMLLSPDRKRIDLSLPEGLLEL